MLCLGANEEMLTRYQPLKDEDLRVSAAVTILNAKTIKWLEWPGFGQWISQGTLR